LDVGGQQGAIKEYLLASLVTREVCKLASQMQPDKLSFYRFGLKSFFEEARSLEVKSPFDNMRSPPQSTSARVTTGSATGRN